MADWKRFQLFICSVIQILGIFLKVQVTHIHVFCDIFHIKVIFWSTTKLYPLSDSFYAKSWLRKICKFSLGFFPGITLTKAVRAVLIWHDYCFSNPKSNHFLFFLVSNSKLASLHYTSQAGCLGWKKLRIQNGRLRLDKKGTDLVVGHHISMILKSSSLGHVIYIYHSFFWAQDLKYFKQSYDIFIFFGHKTMP